MKENVNSGGKKKDLLSLICIAASVVGLILGIRFPAPVGGVFSAGTCIAFICFMLSLGCVKDKGSNLPAILAFSVSFLAMAVSIFCSGMMAA